MNEFEDDDLKRALEESLRMAQQEEEKQKLRAEQVRRELVREQIDGELMDVLPLSLLDLVMFSSNVALQERLLLQENVSFQLPSELKEGETFVVLFGSEKGIEGAKRVIWQEIKKEQPSDDVVELERPVSSEIIRPDESPCKTYIFVDSSNILIGGLNLGHNIKVAKFCALIERGRRHIVERYAVGG